MSDAPQGPCSSVEDAVVALETLDLCALTDDPCALAEAMIVRQHALDYLKLHPPSAVSEPARTPLRRRLESVLARDAEALALLREARAQVGGQLDSLVCGRAQTRGYGSLAASDSISSGIKRVG